MGTQGYRIYRYQGLWFVYWSPNGSYPRELGVEVASEIPADPVKFEAYVTTKKEELQKLIDEDSEVVTKYPPKNDLFIEWMYEINLDHYIFHVDGEPLFDLRNMPYGDDFLNYIGSDPFGRRCYASDTPQKHRYQLPEPPAVDPEILATYPSFKGSTASAYEVLNVPPILSPTEAARMHIMQTLVAASMSSVRNFEGMGIDAVLFPSVTRKVQSRIESFCQFFFGPLVFTVGKFNAFGNYLNYHNFYLESSFQWILEFQFCILVVPRIDQEALLIAAIADMIQNVVKHYEGQKNVSGSVIYGVIFSLYQVSIVRLARVERDGEWTFDLKHTPALHFLPPDYTTITPGIEALARFGQLGLERRREHELVDQNKQYHSLASHSKIRLFPLEICLIIAENLHPFSLENFATISSSCAQAALYCFRQGIHFQVGSLPERFSRFPSFENGWYWISSRQSSQEAENRLPATILATHSQTSEMAQIRFTNFRSEKQGVITLLISDDFIKVGICVQ